jgi:hypothetical protein
MAAAAAAAAARNTSGILKAALDRCVLEASIVVQVAPGAAAAGMPNVLEVLASPRSRSR